jgi:hypothetical protein
MHGKYGKWPRFNVQVIRINQMRRNPEEENKADANQLRFASIATGNLSTFCSTILLLLSSSDHLTQLVFFGEFAGKDAQVLDKVMTGGEQSILRSDLAISLNAEFKLGN